MRKSISSIKHSTVVQCLQLKGTGDPIILQDWHLRILNIMQISTHRLFYLSRLIHCCCRTTPSRCGQSVSNSGSARKKLHEQEVNFRLLYLKIETKDKSKDFRMPSEGHGLHRCYGVTRCGDVWLWGLTFISMQDGPLCFSFSLYVYEGQYKDTGLE